MSSIYYALMDDNDICISVLQYGQTLDNPPSNYKVIASFDRSLAGKKWNGSIWEEVVVAETAESARAWRNEELYATDTLVLLPDYPQKAGLAAYRQELRDWPSTADFPDTKPTLGS